MSDCIEWTKYRNSLGYGQQRYQGKLQLAHRVAFFEANGHWPNVCRHTCDNPPCVNPEHLLDGTHADNTRDMHERGRFVGTRRNEGMPSRREEGAAYQRELRRRQKEGTWNYAST